MFKRYIWPEGCSTGEGGCLGEGGTEIKVVFESIVGEIVIKSPYE